jgi:hypothetical protein
MAAIPNTLASLKSVSPAVRVEAGKPITSVTNFRPAAGSRKPASRTAAIFTLPKEPEDARITGGTRSLDRRLLALNVSGQRPAGN